MVGETQAKCVRRSSPPGIQAKAAPLAIRSPLLSGRHVEPNSSIFIDIVE
jgi:hypothetical protein